METLKNDYNKRMITLNSDYFRCICARLDNSVRFCFRQNCFSHGKLSLVQYTRIINLGPSHT